MIAISKRQLKAACMTHYISGESRKTPWIIINGWHFKPIPDFVGRCVFSQVTGGVFDGLPDSYDSKTIGNHEVIGV